MHISTEFLVAYGAGLCGGVIISIFIVRYKISPIIIGMQYYITRVRVVKHSIFKLYPDLPYNLVENVAREICVTILDQVVSEFDGFWTARLVELVLEADMKVEDVIIILQREGESLLARIGRKNRKNIERLRAFTKQVSDKMEAK